MYKIRHFNGLYRILHKLLSLPEVADGDKRLQSLNYVNADKADIYQEIEGEEKENV